MRVRLGSLDARALVFALGLFGWCERSLSPSDEEVIARYLECDDCGHETLRPVIRLGQRAVPVLTDYLEHGPPAPRVARERQLAQLAFLRVQRYAAAHPSLPHTETDTAFVRAAVAKLDSRYRTRAALALAGIGGRDPEAALCRALQLPLPQLTTDQIRGIVLGRAIACP
jgi:hypothetical protein